MSRLPCALAALILLGPALAQPDANLLPDPSIEGRQEKNQFGVPFAPWSGWIFEGAPEFRNAKIARTGETCAEIVGAQGGKIRLYTPTVTLPPGRYRFSCYIRGLDIGKHAWGLSEDVNVGHIKPINSQRYLSDAHEYIFHFTRSGTVDLDRLAVGVAHG